LKKFSRALCSARLAEASLAGEACDFSVFCVVGAEGCALCAKLWDAQIVNAIAQKIRCPLESRGIVDDEALVFLVSMDILVRQYAVGTRVGS
jgi:hypothetical protein